MHQHLLQHRPNMPARGGDLQSRRRSVSRQPGTGGRRLHRGRREPWMPGDRRLGFRLRPCHRNLRGRRRGNLPDAAGLRRPRGVPVQSAHNRRFLAPAGGRRRNGCTNVPEHRLRLQRLRTDRYRALPGHPFRPAGRRRLSRARAVFSVDGGLRGVAAVRLRRLLWGNGETGRRHGRGLPSHPREAAFDRRDDRLLESGERCGRGDRRQRSRPATASASARARPSAPRAPG